MTMRETPQCTNSGCEPRRHKSAGTLLRWVLVAALSVVTFTVLTPQATASVACDPIDGDTGTAAFNAPNGTYHEEFESNRTASCNTTDGTSTKTCTDNVYQNGTKIDTQTITVTEDYKGRVVSASSPRNGTVRGSNTPQYGELEPAASLKDDPNLVVEKTVAAGNYAYTGVGYVQQLNTSGVGPRRVWTIRYLDALDGGQRTIIIGSNAPAAEDTQRYRIIQAINKAREEHRSMTANRVSAAVAGGLGAFIVYGSAKYSDYSTWRSVSQQAFWLILGSCASLVVTGVPEARGAALRYDVALMDALVELDELWDLVS